MKPQIKGTKFDRTAADIRFVNPPQVIGEGADLGGRCFAPAIYCDFITVIDLWRVTSFVIIIIIVSAMTLHFPSSASHPST